MPYAPAQLVLSAVAALEGASPLAVVTIPALLRAAKVANVDPVEDGVPFGSTEESELLTDYFRLPRPPEPDRPYRAPWAKATTKEAWQKQRYPGGVLQRIRTDHSARGRVLLQTKPSAADVGRRDVWQLTAAAGAELMAATTTPKPVRLVDLAVWFGREQDVTDIDGLLEWFNEVFQPRQGDLVGTIYLDDVPGVYREVPFTRDPIDESTAQQLGSLPPAPTVEGTLADLIRRLEARLSSSGYRLPKGLVRRVLTAWLRGDLVVLVGQPGTGKTLFAGLLGRAMEADLSLEPPLLIPVRADFDEAEFIGYERLDGTPELRDFATAILQTGSPLEARVVVLEEFNLASVETYMASVLVAAQEQERLIRLPAGLQSQLPVDTFIIATCNSYRDEPETRTRVSSPTKRRSTIITMPNLLGEEFDADPDNAVLNLVVELVQTEARRVATRINAHRGAQFDSLRLESLNSVRSLDDFSPGVRDALVDVTGAILNTSVGRSWFTLGLLRDVVLEIAHADRNEQAELEALGQAVGDKLVHQLRGSHNDIQELREACADMPNASELALLLDRMMDGPDDELIPLL